MSADFKASNYLRSNLVFPHAEGGGLGKDKVNGLGGSFFRSSVEFR